VDSSIKEIIESSPYLLLSTQDTMGNTELSPRGDPAGFVKFIDENHVLLPERPGNKIAVSLTNIINNPAVGLSFLTPGSNQIIYLEGNAQITTDQALLSPLAIKEKIPKLGILIAINKLSSHISGALESTVIWQQESHISRNALTPFSKALTAHIQGEGLLGKLSHPIMSGIIKHDMNNLY
jgi:predicted pyridoxine 5'-phosphate oxidase superfamily flavin-nucleotide-binding protein